VNKCIQSLDLLLELKDPQVIYMLLRYCLGSNRLIYRLRTTHPDHIGTAAKLFDEALLRIHTAVLVENGPGFGDFQFELTSLPISNGGLGIHRLKDLKLFTFLASFSSSFDLSKRMFPSISADKSALLQPQLDEFMRRIHPSVTVDRNELLGTPQRLLAQSFFSSQKVILREHPYLSNADANIKSAQSYILDACASTPVSRRPVIVLSPTASASTAPVPLTSQWLSAFPNEGLGQKLSSLEFRAAIYLRLLIPFRNNQFPSRQCTAKGCTASYSNDRFGYHTLSCGGKGNRRTARHDTIMDALFQLLSTTGFHPVRNAPVFCLGLNGASQRPADILIYDHTGAPTCIDGTCCSPLSEAKANSASSSTLGLLCQTACQQKVHKHEEDCRRAGYSFLPFSCDVSGFSTHTASALLDRIASSYAARNDTPFGCALNLIRRKISLAIQRGVARQLIHWFHPRTEAWGDL